jgi:hypothetical protein
VGLQGVEAPRICRQLARVGGKVVSPRHWPSLPPKKYSRYSYLLEAKPTPRAIVPLERLSHLKIPMTQSGIEIVTFRLVA